jgi:tetratricopeptide (TPR) repeat protein
LFNLAETYFKMGRYTEALKFGKEALALRQAKLGPDHRETLWSMQIVADSYAQLGRGAEAIKHYELLLSQWEKKLGADHRENADRSIRLAWCLAFSPDDAQTHDPRRAVALAERGVKLAPEVGGYWRTLGVAHYRAGDWKAAVAALDKSISLGEDEDDWWCLNWTFLAMAHWQMGDKDEARKYYDQATKWMEERNSGDIVLRHFQDEAEELLKKHD